MYLTYNEYEEFGGTLDETTFNQLEFEARSVIDYWTFNRLQREETQSEAVKRCMFKLIALIIGKQKAIALDTAPQSDLFSSAGIASESNDGVSTTYNILTARDAIQELKNELEDTIRRYLLGLRNSLGQTVLYRGLYPNE